MNESQFARQRLCSQLTTRSPRAWIKPLSKNWYDKLFAVVFCCSMFGMHIMRRMRHFAYVQLREQYENKRLNQGHKDTQRHQQYWRRPRPWRRERGERLHHLFVRKQVSEKTNAE